MGSNIVTDFVYKPEHNTSNGKLHFFNYLYGILLDFLIRNTRSTKKNRNQPHRVIYFLYSCHKLR